MKAHIVYSVLFLSMLFVSGCGQRGPYLSMSILTAYGREIISSSCSAWTDGCTIYCRTNKQRGFTEYANKDRCNQEDTARSRCVDDGADSYKKPLPEGWSYTEWKDDCIH